MRKYFIDAIIFFIILNIFFLFCFTIINKIRERNSLFIDVLKKQFLYVYICTIIALTVLPYWRFDIESLEIIILPFTKEDINYIPFKTIYNYFVYSNTNVDNWGMVSFVNVLGNIAFFIPIGFLFIYQKGIKLRTTLVIAFLITFFIEVTQYFTGRVSDIDDLILNMIGTYIGCVLAKYLKDKIVINYKNKGFL